MSGAASGGALVPRGSGTLGKPASALAARVIGDLARRAPTLRVVWLEDNETCLEILREYLPWHMPDLDVTFVEDGDEALRLVSERMPDVLFTDWDHPGMSGPELIAAVRADPLLRGVRTVLTFSMGVEEEEGRPDYLFEKPWDLLELGLLLTHLHEGEAAGSPKPEWLPHHLRADAG